MDGEKQPRKFEPTNTAHEEYFFLTLRHLRSARELFGRYDKGDGSFGDFEDFWLGSESAEIVVVFSGMAVEAFINHLSYEKLPGYLYDKLDRLSTPAKWAVIPKLVYGKGIDPSSDVIAGLERIRKERDRLVHFKTKRVPPEDRNKNALAMARERLTRAEGVFTDMVNALLALNAIAPEFEGEWVDYWVRERRLPSVKRRST